jgi:hypothetical protein
MPSSLRLPIPLQTAFSRWPLGGDPLAFDRVRGGSLKPSQSWPNIRAIDSVGHCARLVHGDPRLQWARAAGFEVQPSRRVDEFVRRVTI